MNSYTKTYFKHFWRVRTVRVKFTVIVEVDIIDFKDNIIKRDGCVMYDGYTKTDDDGSNEGEKKIEKGKKV